MKRPPALSDSLIYIGNYNFQSNEIFMSEYKPVPSDELLVANLTIRQTSALDGFFGKLGTYVDCEIICDYSIRFLTHITLISIFETVFFFLYVSVDEDTGISSVTSYYTNGVLDSCKNLTQEETTIVDDLLRMFVNSTNITINGYKDSLYRNNFNKMLQILSWKYVAGLLCILFSFIGIAVYRKYKIKWSVILIENLCLVGLLGIYEYMFFNTIVKNYLPETPGEISAKFITGLQNQCNLLKN